MSEAAAACTPGSPPPKTAEKTASAPLKKCATAAAGELAAGGGTNDHHGKALFAPSASGGCIGASDGAAPPSPPSRPPGANAASTALRTAASRRLSRPSAQARFRAAGRPRCHVGRSSRPCVTPVGGSAASSAGASARLLRGVRPHGSAGDETPEKKRRLRERSVGGIARPRGRVKRAGEICDESGERATLVRDMRVRLAAGYMIYRYPRAPRKRCSFLAGLALPGALNATPSVRASPRCRMRRGSGCCGSSLRRRSSSFLAVP